MLLESHLETTTPQPPTALGVYTHVPFCATTCNFCAFVQEKPNRKRISTYLETIRKEWRMRMRDVAIPIQTLFWGGGTPGVLLPNDLQQLGEIFQDRIDRNSLKEWTVELAPATVTPSKLQVLKSIGVNRISMGVQTFSDEALKIMDRFHTVSQVQRAWDWIQEEGFTSCNIDMIIAYPGQTKSQLLNDMEKAIQLNPDHLSTYCLTFEEDTPLYAKLMQGTYKIDREQEAELYTATWEFLETNGYAQYEISNFAKHGHQSIHNCNTWKMQDWVGVGPSASSQYNQQRWTNSYNLEKWVSGIESNHPETEESLTLDSTTLITDSLIFGLRMNEGLDIQALNSRFSENCLQRWKPLFSNLVSEGLAEATDKHFRLTLQGRLLADSIAVEVLRYGE